MRAPKAVRIFILACHLRRRGRADCLGRRELRPARHLHPPLFRQRRHSLTASQQCSTQLIAPQVEDVRWVGKSTGGGQPAPGRKHETAGQYAHALVDVIVVVFEDRRDIHRRVDGGLETLSLVRLERRHRFGDISLSPLRLLALLRRKVVVRHSHKGPHLVKRHRRVFEPGRRAEFEQAGPPAEHVQVSPELLDERLRRGFVGQRSQLLVSGSTRQRQQVLAGFRD